MVLFRRLRSLVGCGSVELPPTEVFAALIDDLYSALVSFAIGAITATLVGGIAAWRTGNSWLTALAVATAAVAAARVLLIISYRKHKKSIGGDAAALRRWERWYAIGASAYGACIGSVCFVAFAFINDPVSHLLLNSNAVGFAAGTTARNSSQPRIAVTQVSFILLPIVIGCAFRFTPAYLVLSLIVFLYYLATIEIAQYLGKHRLRLLLAIQEKGALARSLAEQNFRFDAALANMSHGLCLFDAQHRLLVWNKRFCEIYRIKPEELAAGTTSGRSSSSACPAAIIQIGTWPK
jgi:PAS domain-containing protein